MAVKAFSLFAGVVAMLAVLPPAASAETAKAALVHATTNNDCRLNVRALPDLEGTALTTLTCDNYTTCANAEEGGKPCAPYVVGGKYSCVGPNNTQVTDNRWAKVKWRSPKKSYVAVACAAFRK